MPDLRFRRIAWELFDDDQYPGLRSVPPPPLPAAIATWALAPIVTATWELAPIPTATWEMAPIPSATWALSDDEPLSISGSEAWLEWEAPSDPSVTGFRLYHGTQSGIYGPPVAIPLSQTTYVATGLSPGDHYFMITAVSATGESDVSGEVHVVI